ncbi:MAG: ammonium transporter, partial [Asticcacaulis sp.]
MTTPPVSAGLMAHQAALSADPAASGWIMVSTVLVLLMSLPGLALFYGGMVRRKNVLATLAQTVAAAVLAMILWALIGYSLAFAEGGSASVQALIGGFDATFLNGVGIQTAHKLAPGLPEPLWIAFQMTFAMITPAIIAGAFAERMKFSAFLLFTALWLVLVYAPVCHWVWGGGFLGAWGVLDFAGGAVVHINSGVAGLVCALMLGKRRGYGRDNLAPHNLVLTMIGGSLLFVGWIGFNAGSAWAADSIAAMALLNTLLAAATGVVGWVLPEWISRKKPTLLGMLSGLIAGLVGITPAAGFVAPGGAMAIGLLTG